MGKKERKGDELARVKERSDRENQNEGRRQKR